MTSETDLKETLIRIEQTLERNHADHMCLLFVLTASVITGLVLMPWIF